MPALFALLLVTPVAEIVLLISVGQRIGVLATVAFVFATALLGASLVTRQGKQTLSAIQREFQAGCFLRHLLRTVPCCWSRGPCS